MTGVAFNIAQVLWRLVFVFFRYLDSIDPGGWMASMASPTTTLVFLRSLGLTLISRRGGLGLSLVLGDLIAGLSVGIFLVFFRRWTMAFRLPGVDFPNIEGWLQVSLCFYITCLLHYFFLRI